MHSLDPGVKRAGAFVVLAFLIGTFVAIGKSERHLGPMDLHPISTPNQNKPRVQAQLQGQAQMPLPPVTYVQQPQTVTSTPEASTPQTATASQPIATSATRSRSKPLPSAPINVNSATVADLETLPEVGPALAQRIIDSRNAEGPFTSVDDLRRVKGIGPKKLEAIRPYVVVQ